MNEGQRKRLKAILKNLARNNVKVSDDSTGGSLGLTVSQAIALQLGFPKDKGIDFSSEYQKGSKFFFTIRDWNQFAQIIKADAQQEQHPGKKLTSRKIIKPKKFVKIVKDNLIECHYVSYNTRNQGIQQLQDKVVGQATNIQTKQTKRNLMNLLIDKPMQHSTDLFDKISSAKSSCHIKVPKDPAEKSIQKSQQQSLQDLNVNEDIDIEEKNQWAQSMAKYTYPVMANKIALDLNRSSSPKQNQPFSKKMSIRKTSIELDICTHPPILIVDDDEFNILGCQFILQKLSLSSLSANNGERAIQVVKDQCEKRKDCSCKGFKLILMDINMPVMDGYTATKNLQASMKNNQLPYMPIVACTAFASNLEKEAMLEAGMDDYLGKPIQLPQLKKIINKWIKP